MVWLKRGLWGISILLVAIVVLLIILVNPFGPSPINTYRRDGRLVMDGLKAPVRVFRDEKGMAYVYADNKDDLIMAQGYVTAADRLFQMELLKLLSSGRIGELAGPAARPLDITMRTLGFRRNAQKHMQVVNAESRRFLQNYVDGVNAFIRLRPADIHLEFKLAGIRPEPWVPADALGILYYMGWQSAGNLQHEIIGQMLIEKLGVKKAREIFPLNVNPAEKTTEQQSRRDHGGPIRNVDADLGIAALKGLPDLFEWQPLRIGSNNWVIDGRHSASGKPILANDPHLDASMLPGPWYPSGLITPQVRAVGATIPGLPGIVVGRAQGLAFGVTNAYGDAQDLYLETPDPADPGRYIQGGESIAFDIVKETLKFKDKSAPDGYRSEELIIRSTQRGPVVSGLLENLPADRLVTVRWAVYEKMGPSIGLEKTLSCRTINDIHEALQDVNFIALNWVFADDDGKIGWHVSGPLPIRADGDGRTPHVVSSQTDNWQSWIPFDQMPHATNPEAGWLGTANHKTVDRDYPYYYSNYFSSSYRQERIMELLDTPVQKSARDCWQYQRDTVNLKAEKAAPAMAAALLAHSDTAEMGRILQRWYADGDPMDIPTDTIDQAGPTLFHAIFNECARLTFTDELGSDLTHALLNNNYFWEQRLQSMLSDGLSEAASSWFDDKTTPGKTETRDDILHQAASNVSRRLTALLGKNPGDWHWGKVHRYDFYSPIARSGPARRWLGGGNFPAPGSGDTLCRTFFNYGDLSRVTVMASLRMVVDLADADKIMAVLPGGITGRLFHPHTADQIDSFINGDPVYWWFSDEQIRAHRKHELVLEPKPAD